MCRYKKALSFMKSYVDGKESIEAPNLDNRARSPLEDDGPPEEARV